MSVDSGEARPARAECFAEPFTPTRRPARFRG